MRDLLSAAGVNWKVAIAVVFTLAILQIFVENSEKWWISGIFVFVYVLNMIELSIDQKIGKALTAVDQTVDEQVAKLQAQINDIRELSRKG